MARTVAAASDVGGPASAACEAGAAGPTSLAYNGDWNQEETTPDLEATAENFCPRRIGFWFVSRSTGVMVRARCRAHFCGYCGPVNARIEGMAISLAEPRRALLLTKLPGTHQERRTRVKLLLRQLRRDGYTIEMCWHVEPNPAENGHHIHGWQHGDYIPQGHLQERCLGLGLGIPFINEVRQKVGRGSSVGYGLKGVKYGLKNAESVESMHAYLDANGGRLVHATRGFWRDGDERVTLGEARKRSSEHRGSDPGPWELVRIG